MLAEVLSLFQRAGTSLADLLAFQHVPHRITTEIAYFGSWALVITGSALTLFLALGSFRKRQHLIHALKGKAGLDTEKILPLIRQYGHFEKHSAGTTLFSKGDEPDKLYLIESGTVLLSEMNIRLGNHQILGELGVFTPEALRTCSAVCESDCTTYVLPYETMLKLFQKHPQVSLHLTRLIVERLSPSTPLNA